MLSRSLGQAGKAWGPGHLALALYRNIDQLQFPVGSAGKESTCNAGDLGSIPGLGRSAGEGKGYPLQYSGLEKSMDCIVHGLAKSQTGLNDFHFSQSSLKDPSSLILVVGGAGCSHLYLGSIFTWVPSSFHNSLFNLATSSLPKSNLSGDRVGGVCTDNCTSNTNERALIS